MKATARSSADRYPAPRQARPEMPPIYVDTKGRARMSDPVGELGAGGPAANPDSSHPELLRE